CVREYGITYVVLGRTRRPWYRLWFGQSPLDQLLRKVPDVDVLVVDTKADGATGGGGGFGLRGFQRRFGLLDSSLQDQKRGESGVKSAAAQAGRQPALLSRTPSSVSRIS